MCKSIGGMPKNLYKKGISGVIAIMQEIHLKAKVHLYEKRINAPIFAENTCFFCLFFNTRDAPEIKELQIQGQATADTFSSSLSETSI